MTLRMGGNIRRAYRLSGLALRIMTLRMGGNIRHVGREHVEPVGIMTLRMGGEHPANNLLQQTYAGVS